MDASKLNLIIVTVVAESKCEWLPWVDRDDPSATRDAEFYENKDFNCEVAEYEVSLVSGGPAYNDLSSVPHNKLVWIQQEQGISCINKEQKDCKIGSDGMMQGPSPPCCLDYKIRFCCKTRAHPLPGKSET